MKLFVGLGNPGKKYARQRHNAGFMVVDLIAERHGLGPWRKRFQGEAIEGLLGTDRCLFLKPMTYMNESGRAVGEAVRFYKIPIEDVIVFHDEVDLKPGKVRVKTGGGNAGHNGLKSISALIGSGFRRVRIGVGHPGDKDKVPGYVLHDFAKADYEWLDPLLDAIADSAPLLAESDDVKFMNEVARLCRTSEPEPIVDEAAERADGPSQSGPSHNMKIKKSKDARAEGPLASALRKLFRSDTD